MLYVSLFYSQMLQEEEICNLSMELGDLEIFARLLRELSARIKLLKCFQVNSLNFYLNYLNEYKL